MTAKRDDANGIAEGARWVRRHYLAVVLVAFLVGAVVVLALEFLVSRVSFPVQIVRVDGDDLTEIVLASAAIAKLWWDRRRDRREVVLMRSKLEALRAKVGDDDE